MEYVDTVPSVSIKTARTAAIALKDTTSMLNKTSVKTLDCTSVTCKLLIPIVVCHR